MSESRNPFKTKWFQKWEYGFIEGMILGIVFIAFASTLVDPGIFLILILEFIILLVILGVRIPGLRVPRPNKVSSNGEEKESSNSEESRSRDQDVQVTSCVCPSCGAKGVKTKKGEVWFPRHKEGCQLRQQKQEEEKT
jgi:hypothetical protein